MYISPGFLEGSAEIVVLLLCALGVARGAPHFLFGRVTIDFLPSSAESYFYTPDIAANRHVIDDRSRQFSYSVFRLRSRISTSSRIQLQGATVYAFHQDMARQWAELSAVTLPVYSDEKQIHESIHAFANSNSGSALGESVILDNGSEKIKAQLGAGEVREMVFARIGGFTLTLPGRSRKINGTNYCDMLLRLNINGAAVVFLYSVPVFDGPEESGPIFMGAKRFHNAKTLDIVTWALGARPNPGAEGRRQRSRIWVERRR